jgi:transcription initiation factor TFIIB
MNFQHIPPKIISSRNENKCRECNSFNLVENSAAGNKFCQDCGLECCERMIDYQAEWRNFSEEDKERNDPVRVGRPINTLLTGGGLSTSLSKADVMFGKLVRGADLDSRLNRNFKQIVLLCDKLGLSAQRLKDRACEVFRISSDLALQKSIRLEFIRAASVLYSARFEGGCSNRTFKEMVLATGVPKKKDCSLYETAQKNF